MICNDFCAKQIPAYGKASCTGEYINTMRGQTEVRATHLPNVHFLSETNTLLAQLHSGQCLFAKQRQRHSNKPLQINTSTHQPGQYPTTTEWKTFETQHKIPFKLTELFQNLKLKLCFINLITYTYLYTYIHVLTLFSCIYILYLLLLSSKPHNPMHCSLSSGHNAKRQFCTISICNVSLEFYSCLSES